MGTAIAGILVLALLWSAAGGVIKAYLPGELGYSQLGWVHAGYQKAYGIGIPKWAGWQGFAAAIQTPFRHHKIYLKAGQKIVADYHIRIDRGAMTIHTYRTNLSTIIQGVKVEDMEYVRFGRGVHTGTFEYTAPTDGIYEFDYDIWWDRERSRRTTIPLGDYELVYDISWRLER